MKTKKIASIGILSAISIILVTVIHFPIFPIAPFLEYDPADIPIMLCTFIFGPSVGIIMTTIVCILQGLTVSVSGGIIGIMMHFVATGSFVLTTGCLFKVLRLTKTKLPINLILSTISGIIIWTIVMVVWNIVMTPIFMGTPREAVYAILIPVIVPFNLIKATINSVIASLIFLSIHKYTDQTF